MASVADGSQPRQTWWRIPLYPAAIPVAIVLQAWDVAAIHPAAMYRALAVSFTAALLLTLGLAFVARSRDLGALAATGVLLAVVVAALPTISISVIPIVVLVLVLGLVRRGRPWSLGERVTHAMNFLGAIVLLASAISVVQSGALAEGVEDIQLDLADRGPIGAARAGLPDIYLILLDGYPGSDARALAPEHPLSQLRAELLARGFDMGAHTHSNYLQTAPTLASMLQMRHLQGMAELAPPFGPHPADARRLRRLINDAPALDALRGAGYTTTAIASGFAEVELRRVDHLVEPAAPTEFEHSLIRGTGVGVILQALAPDLLPATQRARIRDSIARVADVAADRSGHPAFIFGHIPAPHPPWVFRADGSTAPENLFAYYSDNASDRGVTRYAAMERDLDQATYVDRLVVEAIDRILRDSPEPPVIVVFSDHGPGTRFDPDQPLTSDLSERTSNILAALTPGHPGLFSPSATPVTILPTLLNMYVGADIPMPDNSTWAWRGSPLDVVRVVVDD